MEYFISIFIPHTLLHYMKKCPKCQIEKSENEYHKNSSHKDGVATYCKECTSERGRRPQIDFPAMKICLSCNLNLPSSDYYFNKTRMGTYCKKCHKAKVTEYHVPLKSSMWSIIGRARKKGLDVMTQKELIDWYESQPKNCHYCKLHESQCFFTKRKDTRLHFDRKNNERGYTVDNIVLACFRCNTIKGKWLTEEQMLEIAQKYLITHDDQNTLCQPQRHCASASSQSESRQEKEGGSKC